MPSLAQKLAAGVSVAVLACAGAAPAMAAIPTTQKQYRLTRSGESGPFQLQMVDAPVRAPGAGRGARPGARGIAQPARRVRLERADDETQERGPAVRRRGRSRRGG